MPRRKNSSLMAACLVALAAAAGGCGGDDRPVLRLSGQPKDICFVMTQGDHYHLCRKCRLTLDRENTLCDEHGRHVSTRSIVVPCDADRLRIRPDGMVMAWVVDGWCGLGQLSLVRVADAADGKEPPRRSKRLWELGVAVVPDTPGCPKVKRVDWALRCPSQEVSR